MEALQFDPEKRILSFIQHQTPKITLDDELIVEVAYAGLCGTDLHIIKGEFPCSKKPFILGHEFSGVVREAGSSVTHVGPGDRVVIDPQSWCTTCEFCTTARYHLCITGGVDFATGISVNGGWAKYAKVRARQVYRLPDSLSLKQGALCEPFSCVVWGLERALSDVSIGAKILIAGAGIIGNIWCAVLHHLGHRRVTVIEPSPTRRAINGLLETNFDCVAPNQLNDNGISSEFDLAIDCSGNGHAIEQAISLLRAGGKLCIFGVAAPETMISVSPYIIFKKELTIVGTNINRFAMRKAISLMEAMGERYVDYKKLGIQEYKMKNFSEGIEELKKGSVSKITFQINSQLDK